MVITISSALRREVPKYEMSVPFCAILYDHMLIKPTTTRSVTEALSTTFGAYSIVAIPIMAPHEIVNSQNKVCRVMVLLLDTQQNREISVENVPIIGIQATVGLLITKFFTCVLCAYISATIATVTQS